MKKNSRIFSIIKISKMATIFLFVVILVKLTYVAISPKVDGIDLNTFALSRTTATKTIEASRGTIYDINNEVLATNVRSYTVIAYLDESRTSDEANPRHVVDKETTAEKLSPLINMTPKQILKLLNTKNVYQVELGPGGRNITELIKEEIEALDLPGIDFIKSTKREYPNGDFASYIIGYAKKNDEGSIVGELGIEGKYNNELTGTNGKTIYQKDAYGYRIANTPEVTEEAKNGYDIYLTLDSNIQLYLENAIKEIENFNIDWATITIADAKTGAIVGSTSSPSYNPNILNITDYNNPLVSYTYEPGSTMKIYSFMAAIEEGLYKGDELYQSGSIQVSDYNISDWNKEGWGKITYDKGFTYSSNVAAVLLSQKLGKEKLLDYYKKFGFGKKTGIELSNEYDGKIKFNYESELASASYGQGITTTPIQNIQALTSLSNGGTILKPYIISKIVDNEGNVVYEGKRTELTKVVSSNTVKKMMDLMDETVNSEDTAVTGYRYHTDKLTLIGKTGTANYTQNGKYVSGQYSTIRSFAGLFPKDDPKYIIYVSVKKFQGASSSLGNIIKKMVESVVTYKNLSDKDSNVDESKVINIASYINQGKNETVKLLEKYGLCPIVIGDGEYIINQYPSTNSSVLYGSKVFLVTNGNNITMPNVIGWTHNEINTFAKLIKINYNIDGYGKVINTNIPEGSIIDLNNDLLVELG
ncbi:MAG: PASTA domain-containing protein [Bacilli bacterium]|nr:PASTA domain-containing protein [Bacilli bacterium]